MISNKKKQKKLEAKPKQRWQYLAVKKLSALLRGPTSKNDGGFWLSELSSFSKNKKHCLHSLRTRNNLESHSRAYENKDFYNPIMPSEGTKILELNQYQKSDKAPFIVSVDLECIIEKTDV